MLGQRLVRPGPQVGGELAVAAHPRVLALHVPVQFGAVQGQARNEGTLELPRFGGHLIIGHAMLVRRCSRVAHPPGLPSGIQG